MIYHHFLIHFVFAVIYYKKQAVYYCFNKGSYFYIMKCYKTEKYY